MLSQHSEIDLSKLLESETSKIESTLTTSLAEEKDIPRRLEAGLTLHELRVLAKESKDDKEHSIATKVQKFLGNRWERIRHTDIAYPHDPHGPLTKICLTLAERYASKFKTDRYKLLMPTLKESKHSVTQTNLADSELKLSDFILTDKDKGFIEVGPCIEMAKETGEYHYQFVPEKKDPSQPNPQPRKLSPDEVERLINHSQLTRESHQAIQTVISYLKQDKSVGARLLQLIEDLREGGKSAKNGGTEYKAGQPAYTGVKEFRLFLDSISAKDREDLFNIAIPNPVEYPTFKLLWLRLLLLATDDKEIKLSLTEEKAIHEELLTPPENFQANDDVPCVESVIAPEISAALAARPELYRVYPEEIKDSPLTKRFDELKATRDAKIYALDRALKSDHYRVGSSYGNNGRKRLGQNLLLNQNALPVVFAQVTQCPADLKYGLKHINLSLRLQLLTEIGKEKLNNIINPTKKLFFIIKYIPFEHWPEASELIDIPLDTPLIEEIVFKELHTFLETTSKSAEEIKFIVNKLFDHYPFLSDKIIEFGLCHFPSKRHLLLAQRIDYDDFINIHLARRTLQGEGGGALREIAALIEATQISIFALLKHIRSTSNSSKILGEILSCIGDDPLKKSPIKLDILDRYLNEAKLDTDAICNLLQRDGTNGEIASSIFPRLSNNIQTFEQLHSTLRSSRKLWYLTRMLKENISRTVTTTDHLTALWNSCDFSEPGRELLKATGSNLNTIIPDISTFCQLILALDDAEKRESFICAIPPKHLERLFPITNIMGVVSDINSLDTTPAGKRWLYFALTHAYIEQRECAGKYTSCFGRFFGYEKFHKVREAKKFKKSLILQNPGSLTPIIPFEQPAAEGRLGMIVMQYNAMVASTLDNDSFRSNAMRVNQQLDLAENSTEPEVKSVPPVIAHYLRQQFAPRS
jgi:hypothetical protein